MRVARGRAGLDGDRAQQAGTESLDTANLHPMLCAAEEELHAAGVTDALGIVLADAG